MTKGMCIAYEVGTGLYLNVTNRCPNRCSFCIRNNADGAYGSESLWLEREPTVEEIVAAVLERDLTKYTEIVFCGYGEPTVRLYDVTLAIKKIRENYSGKIRINTNGLSDLIHSRDTALDYSVFDAVSISLNASNSEDYENICHPVYKNLAFPAILKFAENVNKYVQNTYLSVVGDFLSADEIEECREIANKLSIHLRVRDYVAP